MAQTQRIGLKKTTVGKILLLISISALALLPVIVLFTATAAEMQARLLKEDDETDSDGLLRVIYEALNPETKRWQNAVVRIQPQEKALCGMHALNVLFANVLQSFGPALISKQQMDTEADALFEERKQNMIVMGFPATKANINLFLVDYIPDKQNGNYHKEVLAKMLSKHAANTKGLTLVSIDKDNLDPEMAPAFEDSDASKVHFVDDFAFKNKKQRAFFRKHIESVSAVLCPNGGHYFTVLQLNKGKWVNGDSQKVKRDFYDNVWLEGLLQNTCKMPIVVFKGNSANKANCEFV